jgi:putative membrane protein insertion efficiency factor
LRYFIAWVIRLYQLTLSFWLGRQCRFLPSCSEYARQAVLKFGVVRGLRLGVRRLAKCHPFTGQAHSHAFDPVPDSWQEALHQQKRCCR